MKKKYINWVLMAILAVVFVAVGMMIGKRQPQSDANQAADTSPQKSLEPVMAVEAISPTFEVIDETLNTSGLIVAKEVAQVGSKVSGVVVKDVLVQEGDIVQAGQVLAVLDDSSYRESLGMAQAELTQALATQAKAQADLARVEPLLGIDAISRQQYDAYTTAKVQADASVQAVTARLNNAQIQAQNTQVIAPVSGYISKKTAQIGMMATGSALFSIVKDGVLEWQVSLPPNKVGQLMMGQQALVGEGQAAVQAVVTHVSAVANSNKELTVHATLAPNPYLREGMYQSGQFLLSQQQLPTLPARTITTTDGASYVWTLKKQQSHYVAHREPVEILGRKDELVAVALDPSTLVVKEGGNFLNEGSVVNVVNADRIGANAGGVNAGKSAGTNSVLAHTNSQAHSLSTTTASDTDTSSADMSIADTADSVDANNDAANSVDGQ